MKNDKNSRSTETTATVSISTGLKTRRNLITGGIAAGVSLPFLPRSSTRPVVHSVLLPAHAQTSQQGETGSCSQTDAIPGQSVSCEDVGRCTLYSFFIENGCLLREESDCPASGSELQANQLMVEVTRTEDTLNVHIRTSALSLATLQYCQQPSTDDSFFIEDVAPQTLTIDGVTHQVTGEYGRTEKPPAVFVGDITVAPG